MATKKKKEKSLMPWLIGGTALFLIFGGKKDSSGSSSGGSSSSANHSVTDAELASAFNALKIKYGATFAKEIEQLYRKETAHFKSGQFLKTYSPGMEIATGKTSFPWGWGSLDEFSKLYKPTKADHKPVNASTMYTVPMTENNTGKTKYYIGFPDLFSAVQFVGFTLNKRTHPGYWRSTQKDIADNYRTSYKQINTQFT